MGTAQAVVSLLKELKSRRKTKLEILKRDKSVKADRNLLVNGRGWEQGSMQKNLSLFVGDLKVYQQIFRLLKRLD